MSWSENDPYLDNDSLGYTSRGGDQNGSNLNNKDILYIIKEALDTFYYKDIKPTVSFRTPDLVYSDNISFWGDALRENHFPSAYICLNDFHLMEWLPFAPGRYFTHDAYSQRNQAAYHISLERNEYLPAGKVSMVRGGIGAIRLAEKQINGTITHFLGASSTGIAHQGIPVALPAEEYRKAMPLIKKHGGCRATLTGSLQTVTEDFPALSYDRSLPRYCFFAEDIKIIEPSQSGKLMTTVASMFTTQTEEYVGYNFNRNDDPNVVAKSWTFCSFNPGESGRTVQDAAEWLFDYAKRYSGDEPKILTDFDEQYKLFPCRVEFPISDIVRGTVDLDTLNIYKEHFSKSRTQNTFARYIGKVYINMSGNQFINNDNVKIGAQGTVSANAITVEGNVSSPHLNPDQETLSDQLARLLVAARTEATEPDQKLAVGAIDAATDAAAKGNEEQAIGFLKMAGKWGYDLAIKITADLAAEAIKKYSGL